MRVLNRSAFVVRPRDPYLRWAAALDDDTADAVGDLRERVAIYLVPEDPRGENETRPIEDFHVPDLRARARSLVERSGAVA